MFSHTCFIQCAPLAGESGWRCILGGELGSALPATTQLEVWKAYLHIDAFYYPKYFFFIAVYDLYRLSSTGVKSIMSM